jgi:hypothetical protein
MNNFSPVNDNSPKDHWKLYSVLYDGGFVAAAFTTLQFGIRRSPSQRLRSAAEQKINELRP